MSVVIKHPAEFPTLEAAHAQISALNAELLLKPPAPSSLLLLIMWMLAAMSFTALMMALLLAGDDACVTAINGWLLHFVYLVIAIVVCILAMVMRANERKP